MKVDNSKRAKDYTRGRTAKLSHIVIHHWGVDGQTHNGVVDYFVRGNPNKTSAHFVVSGGRVTQLVSLSDTAHHCRGFNAQSIGIECRPEANQNDIAAVVWTIRHVRSLVGDLPLIGHRERVATACPGRWQAMLGELDTRARQIGSVKETGITVGYEVIFFTHKSRVYEADIVGGTYHHIGDPDELKDRQFILTRAGIRHAWWRDVSGGPNSEVGRLDALGVDRTPR